MAAPIPKAGSGDIPPTNGEGRDERPGLHVLREAQRGPTGDRGRTGRRDADDRGDRGAARPAGQGQGAEFESFEKLKLQPKQIARYLRTRESIQKMFIAIESELGSGDSVIEMRQQVLSVLEIETNADKKKKLQELLNADPLADKSKLIKELIELYKDDPARKDLFEKLLTKDTERTSLADKISSLKKGEAAVALLSDLLDEKPGLDKKGTLFSLIDLCGNEADKKVLRAELGKILVTEALADSGAKGQLALTQLKTLSASDKDKAAVIDDILSGKVKGEERAAKLKALLVELSAGKDGLPEVLKRLEQDNYQKTRELFPVVADYLERAVPNDVVALGLKMLKGTTKDPHAPFPTHFFEGCPIKLPDVPVRDTKFKATWEGFLVRVARGQEKLTLPHDLNELLAETDGTKTALFVNSTDWFTKAETSLARESRIYMARLLNDKLQGQFHAPETWQMPPVTDARRLDRWFKAASDMNNLMEMVTGYVQGYLDLQELDPDIAKQTDANSPINRLRELGAIIEWDPVTRRLTRCDLPLTKNLNLLLPENDQAIAALRKWVEDYHEPIDRAADAYAKGRASWLRWGDFREPVDPGKGEGGKDRKAAVIKDADGHELRVENCHGEVLTIWHNGEVIHRTRSGRFISKDGTEVTDIPRRDNEVRAEFDYIRHSFSGRRTGRKGPDGKEIVEISVERLYCQESPVNFERWGSDIDSLVGSELSTVAKATETLELKEGQRAVVQDSVTHRSELLRAEDLVDDLANFGGWKWREQWLFHHGAKFGDMALNIGLTVSGGAEVVALKSFGSVALGTLRFAIGASGFLEPALRAGCFDEPLRQIHLKAEDIENARALAILVDIWGVQAGGGVLRWLSGSKAVKAASAVGRWGKAVEAASLIGHGSMIGGMVLTAPVLGQQMYSDWNARTGHFADRNGPLAIDDRRIPWEDFRKANPDFALSDPKAQAVLKEILDTYSDTLSLGAKEPETKERIHKLFEEAQEVISLKPDDPRRIAFIQKLVGYHRKSGDELLLDRLAADPKLTERAVRFGEVYGEPPDTEAEANRQTVTRLGKEAKLSDISEQERIAAMQCLVILATKEDGTLPDTGTIASRQVEIPEHHVKVTVKEYDRQIDEDVDVEKWQLARAQTIPQEITMEEALKYLDRTASALRSHPIKHIRDLSEPKTPIDDLRNLLKFDDVGRVTDQRYQKLLATQYLRKHLYLSGDEANKFVEDLCASDLTKAEAAEKALAKLFAEQSPANKYLRLQLNISVEEAAALLTRLRSADPETSGKAETEIKDKLEVARNANHLAAGDTLWWHGRYKGEYTRQLASICMDIVGNKSLPDELRAKALYDRNCPRLGLLIGEVEALDELLEKSPHDQLPTLFGKTNGATAKDAMELLYSIVVRDGEHEVNENGQKSKPKESSDLRCLCALAILANQQESVDERRAFLGEINGQWEKLSENPGAFAIYAVDLLKKALETNIDKAPNGSEWSVRKDKFDSAMILRSLGRVDLGRDSTFSLNSEEYNKRLLESIAAKPTDSKPLKLLFDPEHAELTQVVLKNLDYAHLTLEQRKAVLDLLNVPLKGETDPDKRSDIEILKLILIQNLPQLLNNGRGGKDFDDLRAAASEKLQAMFASQSPLYAGGCPDLKVAAIEALRDIGWRDAQTREFMEDRLRPATNTGTIDGPIARDNEGHIVWRELPAVRLAALQALYKMNPADPGAVATRHRDLEDDPLVGRVAQDLERLRKSQQFGDPREQSEITQHLELRLLAPSQCSLELGEEYINGSRYKNLLSETLGDSLAGTLSSVYGFDYKGSLQQGYGNTSWWPLSLSVGWDRISNFDYYAPDKKYKGAVDKFWAEYGTLSLDLCNEAMAIPDRTKGLTREQIEENQRKALSAIVWFLKDNCKKCRPDDQRVIRTNFASTLAALCGTQIEIPGQAQPLTISTPVRQLARSYVEMLLKDSTVKADVQMYLVDALHRLHQDGAIDTASAAGLTAKMLRAAIDDQTIRTPKSDDYEDFKKVQLMLLNDMLRYRARYPEAMAVISACAGSDDGKVPGHPIKEVCERAKAIKGLLENGVTLVREDVRFAPDEGTSPAARAANLEAAINNPSENNNNVVLEIFRAVSGNPVTQPDDPRLPILLVLAENNQSPRVRAALGHALLDVATPDGRAALLGLSILCDLKQNDKTILGQEAAERLALLENSAEGKAFLALVQADNKARSESVVRLFWEYDNQPSVVEAERRTDELFKLIKADFDANKVGEDYVKKLAAAWGANGFQSENKKLVGVCRQLLAFSTNEQTRLAAAYAIVHCKTADKIDVQAADEALRRLRTDGSSDAVRLAAGLALDPTAEDKAHAEFDALLEQVPTFRNSITLRMTEGEIERATEATYRQHLETLLAVRAQERVDLEQLRTKEALLRERLQQLRTENERLDRLLKLGIGALFQEVETAVDPKMPVAQRIEKFHEAVKNPGNNNENLIRAIFQMTAGCPITDANDPRLPLLAQLGYRHPDAGVEEAVGFTLFKVNIKDNSAARDAGAWMLADVMVRGNEGQAHECTQILTSIASQSEEQRKAVAALQERTLARTFGVLFTIDDTSFGVGKQEPLTDKDKVAEKVKIAELALSDKSLPGRLKVQALADAWAAGEFKDPTKTLLPLTRKLAQESADEQVRLAALSLLMRAPQILEHADFDLIHKGLEHLAANASNPQIKEEAEVVLEHLKAGDKAFQALLDREKELDAAIAAKSKEIETLAAENKELANEVSRKEAEIAEELQMQKDGVVNTRTEVFEAADQKLSLEARIGKLNEAIKAPGDNNENLVGAVFQLVSGKPITDENDPRYSALLRLGYSHPDTRVLQAVAISLCQDVRFEKPESSKANIECALWMFGDVFTRGKPGQIRECKTFLKPLAENRDIEKLCKGVLQLHSQSVFDAFAEVRKGKSQETATEDLEAIKSKIKRAESGLADSNLPNRLKIRWLSEAWLAGSYDDPTGTLLPLSMNILKESKDEQLRFIAFLNLFKLFDRKGERAFEAKDVDLMRATIKDLAANAKDKHVHEEALLILNALKKRKWIID